MLEELGGASPKFLDLFKSEQTPGLGDRSVSACRNWAFPRKNPAEGRSNLGWLDEGPPGSCDLGGSFQSDMPSTGKAETVAIQMDLITPEQASALVEKGKTLRE